MSETADQTVAAATTITEALQRTAERHGDIVALRSLDGKTEYTWARVATEARDLARGFSAHGIKPGVPAALMMANRPEFHLADLAYLTAGTVPFSIYPTLPNAQIRQLLAAPGARVAIVDPQFLPEIRKASAPLSPFTILVAGDRDSDSAVAWEALKAFGTGTPAPDGSEVSPDDLATRISTPPAQPAPRRTSNSHTQPSLPTPPSSPRCCSSTQATASSRGCRPRGSRSGQPVRRRAPVKRNNRPRRRAHRTRGVRRPRPHPDEGGARRG